MDHGQAVHMVFLSLFLFLLQQMPKATGKEPAPRQPQFLLTKGSNPKPRPCFLLIPHASNPVQWQLGSSPGVSRRPSVP